MSDDKNYFRFASYGLDAFATRSLVRIRRAVVERFLGTFLPTAKERVLDVGASAEDHVSSNVFEKRYPYPGMVTALSCYSFPELVISYPGLHFVQGDACKLPFADDSFDLAYSHAVIEHLGNRERQGRFISELDRITRRGFFLTTPDRLHPLEFHTGLPLVHYLPARMYWRIYRLTGKGFYASMNNLHLFYGHELKHITREILGAHRPFAVSNVWWMMFPAILVLAVRKDG